MDWPLHRELASIQWGIVIVDDFDIGHPRFGFNAYVGQTGGPAMLERAMKGDVSSLHTNNPDAQFPLPCLQTGRRAGRAYVVLQPLENKLHLSRWFLTRPIESAP